MTDIKGLAHGFYVLLQIVKLHTFIQFNKSTSEKIRKTIKTTAGMHTPSVKTFTSTMLQVEKNEYTCTVRSEKTQQTYVARLKAVLEVENKDGFILIAAKDSEVIVNEVNIGEYAKLN